MNLFAKISNTYNGHDIDEDQAERMEAIRKKTIELAICIEQNVPNSREKSLAVTNLEQTQMWAIKSIALNPFVKDDN